MTALANCLAAQPTAMLLGRLQLTAVMWLQNSPNGNPPDDCNADLGQTSTYQRFLYVIQVST